MNAEIKKITEEYLKKNKSCGLSQYFRYFHKDLYNFIFEYTHILNDKYPFIHRLYWVINNISNFPKCKLCGCDNKRVIKFDIGYQGRYQYCSHSCCVKSEECISKRKNTNIQKYGVDVPAKSEIIKNKIMNTCIQKYGSNTYLTSDVGKVNIKNTLMSKYGTTSYAQTEEFKKYLSDIWKNRTEQCKDDIKNKSDNTKLLRYGNKNFNNRSKYKQTMLSKYGVIVPIHNLEIKNKILQTNILKYGYSCCFFNIDIKQKCIKTCLEKYGVDNSLKSDTVRQKIKSKCLEKYGVDNCLKSDIVRQKIKSKCLEKYGVDNYMSTDEFRSKSRDTQLEKYGCMYTQTEDFKNKLITLNNTKYDCDWSLQDASIRNKIKNTCLEKYGVDNILKLDSYRQKNIKQKITKTYEILNNSEYFKPLFTIKEFLNDSYGELEWKCLKCGKTFKSKRSKTCSCYSDLYVKCPICYPSDNTSIAERKITEIIRKKYSDIVVGSRMIIPPKELDIYIPQLKLAIEYNGLYWHCNHMLNNDRKYHLNKTEDCLKKDIQLIHIFEDEWDFKRDIVISRIKNLIGLWDNVVYARKCIIKELDNKTKSDFLNTNHIQGDCASKYNYGLYYNDELVSIMTFGSYRKSMGRDVVNNEYELLRFCNKLNYHIPGGASKLFKHFIKCLNPSKIISYADRRWSKGNLYEKLGFKFVKYTDPNYWYIIHGYRKHRFGYRKNVLKQKLKNYDENLTEYQNMLNNGYDCIYDCGNMLFEYTINS